MSIDQLVAIVSLLLSIFFWWNARLQSVAAEKTLQDIKSQIIGWQAELNKASIEILGSRPEIIAMRCSMSEAESVADFSLKMAELVEKLALSSDPEKAKIIESILFNHASTILERHRIGMAAANARGDQSKVG